VKLSATLLLVIAVLLAGCSGSAKKVAHGHPPPPSRVDVDQRTRGYVHQVKTCRLSIEWAIADTFREANALQIAEETANARDLCNTVRSRLVTMNTDQFDNAANTALSGVDGYRDGLRALFAFADNPDAVGKAIEASLKLREGDRRVFAGLKQINARRGIYNLKPIPVQD
jgi:hypothetical protein